MVDLKWISITDRNKNYGEVDIDSYLSGCLFTQKTDVNIKNHYCLELIICQATPQIHGGSLLTP